MTHLIYTQNIPVRDIYKQTIQYLFASKVTHVVYLDPYHCLDQGVRPI